jgi:histidine triad (HIT) family protein
VQEQKPCLFCIDFANGITPEIEYNRSVVYHDETAIVFIAPKWWNNNPGSALIIPHAHLTDIYTVPDQVMAHIHILSKKVALAMRATYPGCSGITIRNHNEKDGNQTVFHYHVHVTPRHKDDAFYQNIDNSIWVREPKERLAYVNFLKQGLANLPSVT